MRASAVRKASSALRRSSCSVCSASSVSSEYRRSAPVTRSRRRMRLPSGRSDRPAPRCGVPPRSPTHLPGRPPPTRYPITGTPADVPPARGPRTPDRTGNTPVPPTSRTTHAWSSGPGCASGANSLRPRSPAACPPATAGRCAAVPVPPRALPARPGPRIGSRPPSGNTAAGRPTPRRRPACGTATPADGGATGWPSGARRSLPSAGRRSLDQYDASGSSRTTAARCSTMRPSALPPLPATLARSPEVYQWPGAERCSHRPARSRPESTGRRQLPRPVANSPGADRSAIPAGEGCDLAIPAIRAWRWATTGSR